MDGRFWLIFTLAVLLASATAGTTLPTTTTTTMTTTTAFLTTAFLTTTTAFPTTTTTTTIAFLTAAVAFTTTSGQTTVQVRTTVTPQSTTMSSSTAHVTTHHPTTPTTITTGPTTTNTTITTGPTTTNTTITTGPTTTNTTITTGPTTSNTTITTHPPTTDTTITSPPTTDTTITTGPPTTDTTITSPPTTDTTIITHPPTTTYTTITTHHPTTNTTNTTITTRPTTTTATTATTTTTTTPASPTPTTPLVCNNGGIALDGVCICPDEWTGETCLVVNGCEGQTLAGFTFPRTPVGWFAYSEEICPVGTSGAGKPQATTRCSSKTGPPSFDRPQVYNCTQTLNDIQQNLTDPVNLESLATTTQILTSNPEELTVENVTVAAQIANTLLLSPNATKSVRVAAVATVSQLLNTSLTDDTADNITLSLTVTLDQLSLSLSLNSSQSQVVQPNLVVQSAQIPAADTQGVQFTSLTGTSGNFVADRIQLNTNTSNIVEEDGFIPEVLMHILFPSGEGAGGHQNQSNVSLGFVLYQNDRLFQSKLFRRQLATVRVLSASVKGQERNVVPQQVEMLFRPKLMTGTSLYDFSCVFWNYSLQDWSTAGCSKGNASDGVLRCLCNHTTNFAALWSFRENYHYADPLNYISIVGLSFSVLGLVVTIIHHFKESVQRQPRRNVNSKLALLCICISLLAFIITFLSGVHNVSRQSEVEAISETNHILDSDQHVDPDRGPCTAVAALLHFFLLATFMWNSVYGTQLVLLVRTMQSSLLPYWTPLSVALGWGVPAVVVAITLGVTYRMDNPLGYRQEEFCWLAGLDGAKQFDFEKPMFWGFLLPIGLILIYNMVLLVLVSLATCNTEPALSSTSRLSLRKKFLISISLAVLLGLSWTLGYLVLITRDQLVINILFCLCTTTQGFQIFILFTARTSSFRASVSQAGLYVYSVTPRLNHMTYHLWRNRSSKSSSEIYTATKNQTPTKSP